MEASSGDPASLLVKTDALPATWDVDARPDATCQYGGNASQEVTNDGSITITCGDFISTGMTLSPANCTIVYVNGAQEGYCPPYLQATTSTPVLPTSYATAVNLYTEEGDAEGGSQETTSSSTSITIPAPTSLGATVVTLTDPNTNETLGGAIYIVHECFIQTGPYGTTENCPY